MGEIFLVEHLCREGKEFSLSYSYAVTSKEVLSNSERMYSAWRCPILVDQRWRRPPVFFFSCLASLGTPAGYLGGFPGQQCSSKVDDGGIMV